MIAAKREYVLECLARYWVDGPAPIEKLPIVKHCWPENSLSELKGTRVVLPSWATDVGVDGAILVPAWSAKQAAERWQDIDWLAVCFWYLNNSAERELEQKQGPAHSYSLRLKGIDQRFWLRAWVNRIALFLRRWAAHTQQQNEAELLGALPKAKVYLSHDVDAIHKTLAIRFKQTAFHSFNCLRALLQGKVAEAIQKAKQAVRFLISRDNYWCFDEIIALENKYGVKSTFNFYAGKPGKQRSYKQRLLDPAYDVHEPSLRKMIQRLSADGWQIGLHPSFDAWSDSARMKQEKSNLEQTLGEQVSVCRQHWLRFSFERSWQIQKESGFILDTTLGFNDRSAFRNGAALRSQPWGASESSKQTLEGFKTLPMVLMDSHLYDYQPLTEAQRVAEIDYWIDEVKAVGGEASVIWHQRVMSQDYGWAGGYEQLLKAVVR